MHAAGNDPFELHARHYLDKLRVLSKRVRSDAANIDPQLRALDRCWPQILAAFRWASSLSINQAIGAEISREFLACAGGGELEYQGNPQALRQWANAVRDYAEKLTERPNDVAFLYRFAGIALVESSILAIANESRLQIGEVLALTHKALPRVLQNARDRAQQHNSPSVEQ